MNNNLNIFEINDRKFDNCLLSIQIISTFIFFKDKDEHIRKKEIYSFFSCSIKGKRMYLTSVFKDKYTKTSDWYDLLMIFKNRGINVLLYAVVPNNNDIIKAFKLAFKEIFIYISCFDTIDRLCHYYTDSYSSNIIGKLKRIYLANNIDEYNLAFNDFKEEYLQYQFILDLFEDDFKRYKDYCTKDPQIRKFIISFYFVRDLQKRLNKIAKSKDYFSSLDDFVTELIDDIKRIESKIFCTKKELTTIINYLYNCKKDLIKYYL